MGYSYFIKNGNKITFHSLLRNRSISFVGLSKALVLGSCGAQVGVIEAVRHAIDASEKVTAVWVTHRLEELEYADGAIYMEGGRVVLSGHPSVVVDHIRKLRKEAGL